MSDLLRIFGNPELKNPSLVVGWSGDVSKIGTRVINYLTGKLGAESFCEIEPAEFFSLGGVAIEDDVVQFPESKFYACPTNDLLVFKSAAPNYEWYKFLSLVLDVAQQRCRVKELYAVGGMISLSAHTAPREMMSTFNSPVMKEALSQYSMATGLDYETPAGQRPTLNSYLLWTAKRRNIPGVALWVPIPFYLVAADDPKAKKAVLEFFNQRFGLGIDLSDLDEEISAQGIRLSHLRNSSPDINRSIMRLESNLTLSEEENDKLVKEIEKYFRQQRG